MTRRNRHGRPVWFEQSRDGGGVYVPSTAAGWQVLLLTVLWVLVCGIFFPTLMVYTGDWRWLIGMFFVGGAGLLLFAAKVVRHS